MAKSRYRAVDKARFPGLSAFETTKVVYGTERRVVVTHSQNLHDKQSGGFDQTLAKAHRQLGELAQRLARGKTRKPRDGVEAEIAAILGPRWLSRVVTTELVGDAPGELRLSFATDPKARAALEAELFGKRVLFTDKAKVVAPIAVVVADYRSQSEVEADFRQMKDPTVVSFSPMFHWSDHKIRVHVMYCVLALAVARLMVREADRAGMHMSVRELLATLAGIQETVLLYQGERGRPRARRMLTEIDPTGQRLYDLFGLDTFARRPDDHHHPAACLGDPRSRAAPTTPGPPHLPRPTTHRVPPCPRLEERQGPAPRLPERRAGPQRCRTQAT